MEGQRSVSQHSFAAQKRVILTGHHSQIASMGALLVIGGLAVDPLSQQLVHFIDKLEPDPSGNASLLFATNWTASSQSTNAIGKSHA
jgi:hypothetical protein